MSSRCGRQLPDRPAPRHLGTGRAHPPGLQTAQRAWRRQQRPGPAPRARGVPRTGRPRRQVVHRPAPTQLRSEVVWCGLPFPGSLGSDAPEDPAQSAGCLLYTSPSPRD
eukprot:13364582-Alexandrium_andersonii.AAC.1